MRNVIRLGDTTTHGCTIVSGDARHQVDGRAIAFENDMTSCGAKLVSSCPQYRTE